MKKRKHYNAAEELYILDEILNYKSQREAFKPIAVVLGTTESAIQSKFYSLKAKYPKHPAFQKNWKVESHLSTPVKNTKKKTFLQKLFSALYKR